MSKNDEDANAYATIDDWTVATEDHAGLAALTTSIEEHAQDLEGEESLELFKDDELDQSESIPIGSSGRHNRSSARSFNSLSSNRSGGALGTASADRRAVMRTSNLKKTSSYAAPKEENAASLTYTPTKLRATTSAPRGTGTKVRALAALCCLAGSICIAVFSGKGHTGRSITSTMIGITPGVKIKEASPLMSIPEAMGGPLYNGTYDIPDLESMNIALPTTMESGLADWHIPFPASNRSDLPVFWQVKKTGGTVVKKILGECLGLVEVSNEGATHAELSIQILENANNVRYINVDSTTPAGLERAKQLKVASSGIPDVMFTPLLQHAAGIFTPPAHHGRFFTVLRDPLERAVSIYQGSPKSDSMTFIEFAETQLVNNEMTRQLVDKQDVTQVVTEQDLYLAMEILRRKCVIGLVSRMEESLMRFHAYFGWFSFVMKDSGILQCQSKLLEPATAVSITVPPKDSDAFMAIVNQNRLDLRLYDYAMHLYDLQGGNTRTSRGR